jgi:PAS domain S-box-containing protein
LIKSGLLSSDLLINGPWGIRLLRPENLFGITGLDPLSHSVFWCLTVNIGLYVAASLIFETNSEERKITNDFLDESDLVTDLQTAVYPEPSIVIHDKFSPILLMLKQYMPHEKAWGIIKKSLDDQELDEKSMVTVIEMAEFCARVKKNLAGSIGTAQAHAEFLKGKIYTPEESVELTTAYSKILASLALTPAQLNQKIDFYQEREKLISEHAMALEEKVEALQLEIVERMRVEKALKISEDKYRLLVENATDAISIIQDRKIIFSNPATQKLLGYTVAELKGMLFSDLLHPDIRKMGELRYSQRLQGELGQGSYEYQFMSKDRSIITVLVSEVMIIWEKRPAVLFIAKNITDQKKLEAQLLQSQKMEALGTLAGGVAHDFNNLLMGLQGNVSIMLLNIDPQHDDYIRLKNMEEYISDASRLTGQLLGMARKGKFEVKTTDINTLVTKTSSMFGRTRKDLKIRPVLNVVKPVDVDRAQIEQVLLNLFVNAWQAMPEGGVLSILTDNQELSEADVKAHDVAPGAYVRISVTDTGIGMDADIQKKVFDPFFTTKTMGRGTGLGLSSAYGIIKNHNGFITISSKPDEGTTFDVFLPASLKTVSVESKPRQGVLFGTETILLIDDETLILDVGSEILKVLGYKVLTASSGKSAKEIFQEQKDEISLVILDMIMPDESGSLIYDHLKKINPEVKTLLSSGYSFNEQAAEIMKKGCNGFIQKPFGIDVLSRKIREIMGEIINGGNNAD